MASKKCSLLFLVGFLFAVTQSSPLLLDTLGDLTGGLGDLIGGLLDAVLDLVGDLLKAITDLLDGITRIEGGEDAMKVFLSLDINGIMDKLEASLKDVIRLAKSILANKRNQELVRALFKLLEELLETLKELLRLIDLMILKGPEQLKNEFVKAKVKLEEIYKRCNEDYKNIQYEYQLANGQVSAAVEVSLNNLIRDAEYALSNLPNFSVILAFRP